jgi:hypothetical protein
MGPPPPASPGNQSWLISTGRLPTGSGAWPYSMVREAEIESKMFHPSPFKGKTVTPCTGKHVNVLRACGKQGSAERVREDGVGAFGQTDECRRRQWPPGLHWRRAGFCSLCVRRIGRSLFPPVWSCPRSMTLVMTKPEEEEVAPRSRLPENQRRGWITDSSARPRTVDIQALRL